LDEVYAAVFIDAMVVKVREGQVANRPVYAAIGSPWAARHSRALGRDRRRGRQVLDERADRPDRRVKDVFFVVCDGLKGLLGAERFGAAAGTGLS
jgi:putative transposase